MAALDNIFQIIPSSSHWQLTKRRKQKEEIIDDSDTSQDSAKKEGVWGQRDDSLHDNGCCVTIHSNDS